MKSMDEMQEHDAQQKASESSVEELSVDDLNEEEIAALEAFQQGGASFEEKKDDEPTLDNVVLHQDS